MSLNLKALIGKLNGATRNGLEAAAGMCVSLTHYDIEVEHYLTKMLDAADSDVAAILKHFSVDSSRFSKELSRSLEKLKRGNARSPAISPTTQRMLTEAWMIGSIHAHRGMDDRVHRLWGKAHPLGLHHSGPGIGYRIGPLYAGNQPGIPAHRTRSVAPGFREHRIRLARGGSRRGTFSRGA